MRILFNLIFAGCVALGTLGQVSFKGLQQAIGQDLIDTNRTRLQADLQDLLDYVAAEHGTQSPEYAEAVLWAAMIVEQAGDCKQSSRLLKASNKLFKQYGSGPFCGRDTIHEIFRLDLLSALEDKGNRDFYSLRHSKKSLKLKKQYFGETNEAYLNAALDLSRLYAQRLNYKKSTELHNEAFVAYVNLIRDKFCSLSDLEREDYWATAIKYINKTLELADKQGRKSHMTVDADLAAAAYNALLLSKGLLLNTSVNFERFIEANGNASAKELLAVKWQRVQQGASRAVLDSLDYAILDALAADGIKYDIPSLNITWHDVQQTLGDDDLAIEFYRTPSDAYGAVLLKKGWKSPRLINLPLSVEYEKKVYPLASALGMYNSDLQTISEFGSFQSTVSDAIWTDRILSHFPGGDTGKIYFSADGLLQLTGIEYFPQQADPTLPMNDRYKFVRLSSTRTLVDQSVPADSLNNAALFGGLRYDMTRESMAAEHDKYPTVTRSISAAPADLRGHQKEITPLRMTLDEINQISSILDNKSIESELYKENQGVEEAVKALSGNAPAIIHISTHGFYIPRESLSENYERYAWLAMSDSAYVDNPLKRTGLLMAGSHQAYINRAPLPDVEDGILSAYEISQLDLGNAELVVLSACETGLGDITSDGVAGLQRGLKKAGTQCIFMSLWDVDDAATYELMVRFYNHWILENMSKMEALYAAQRDLRTDPAHPHWADPKYWAAFILLDALD